MSDLKSYDEWKTRTPDRHDGDHECHHIPEVFCIACWREAERTLSEPAGKLRGMAHAVCDYCDDEATQGDFCEEHAENWARTQGLISQLALKPLSGKRDVDVQLVIEVDARRFPYRAQVPQWQRIETMSVDSERIVVTTKEGETIVRHISDGAPLWRRGIK